MQRLNPSSIVSVAKDCEELFHYLKLNEHPPPQPPTHTHLWQRVFLLETRIGGVTNNAQPPVRYIEKTHI